MSGTWSSVPIRYQNVGQPTAQTTQPQTQPQITPTTKFDDLPEKEKQVIINFQ